MRIFSNIKVRLTLWFMLILFFILVFFSVLTYFLFAPGLYSIAHEAVDVKVINAYTSENLSANTPDPEPVQPQPLFGYTISEEFLETIKSKPESKFDLHTPLGKMSFNQKDFVNADTQGEQQIKLFFLSSPDPSGAYDVLVVRQSVAAANDTIDAFSRALTFVVPITVVLATGLGFFLVWRMLRPVNAIVKTAREIEEQDLGRRIEVKSRDELGRLATTLNQTFDRLQNAFNRERQFTSDASHELRTPLSIMQGEASLTLKKERSPDEYQRSLTLISQKITYMSSIINKLLVLSRADNGKEVVNLSPVNLKELLTELASDVEALCEDKSLHLKTDLDENPVLEGDKVKLRELFLNLLDNAIRYTPEKGQITLSLRKEENNTVVSVTDTGIGMAEQHLPHIFERFYRVNKTHAGDNDGSGLGLAICKHIVEMHKGKIRVNSKVGEGSTFTVTLPLVK